MTRGLKSRFAKNRWLAPVLALLMMFGVAAGIWAASTDGNMAITGTIQIDNDGTAAKPLNGADLWPNMGSPKNSADPLPFIDWVRLPNDPEYGKPNGLHIKDGVGKDNDIFLSGGKENDVRTWNIGPGTVGSSKYDISQAYMANNNNNLFFGMERVGNNGTTAFDFEFNTKPAYTYAELRAAPFNYDDATARRLDGYVPQRTAGDTLFAFEMSGSGSSGSATPYIFKWVSTGTHSSEGYYQLDTNAAKSGVFSSINNVATKSGPWGTYDSKGNVVTTDIPRFQFAEAVAPLSVLTGGSTSACGGEYFVQVRTRASVTDTSDLKDTTNVFKVVINAPKAAAKLASTCEQTFKFDGTGSTASEGSSAGLVYNWEFMVPDGVTLTDPSGTLTGPVGGPYRSTAATGELTVNLPNGANSAVIAVKNTVDSNGCKASTAVKYVTVYRKLVATADITAKCDLELEYSSTVTGGNLPTGNVPPVPNYSWTLQKKNGAGGWDTVTSPVLTGARGKVKVGSAGEYQALLTVTDAAGDPVLETVTVNGTDTLVVDTTGVAKPVCPAPASDTDTVYALITGTPALTSGCDLTVGFSVTAEGGKAPYEYAWKFYRVASSGSDEDLGDLGAGDKASGTVSVPRAGKYYAEVTVTDSQGTPCTKKLGPSNTVEVNPLPTTIEIEKKTPTDTDVDALRLEVKLKTNLDPDKLNPPVGVDSFQWQRNAGTASTPNWVNIDKQTSATLALDKDIIKGFTGVEPGLTEFSHGGLDYVAKIYQAEVRLQVTRTLNKGLTTETVCPPKNSQGEKVAVMKAVDP